MATWQLQTAKAKLSELLRAVRDGDRQVIAVRGTEEFVVMRKEDAPVFAAKSAPRTWDELYALAESAGDDLVLPPRGREPSRPLQLGDDRAEWNAED